ncbi:YhdP family protein [Viridibacterium curvum]
MSDTDPRSAPESPPATPRRRLWAALVWRLRWLAHWLRLTLHLPRIAGQIFVWSWIVLAVAFLGVRHLALPQVANQRERIQAELSQALGVKLSIQSLEADWPGLRPVLQLRGVQVLDDAGHAALSLPEVEARVAWSSLLHWRLELASLHLRGPELAAKREADGRIFIAGIALQGGGDGNSVDRLLHQHDITISDARLSWLDQQRGAPELVLEKVFLTVQNHGDVHRLAVRAQPAGKLSGPLDLRADLRGLSLQSLDTWRGALFLDLRETDLAVWRAWVDYPVPVTRGKGSLRAWLNFEGPRIAALTTDLALADVETRLAEDLPQLSLKMLTGRLRVSLNGEDYAFSAERLRLRTQEGLEVLPTQLSLRHNGKTDSRPAGGSLAGERLDMRVLSQLAAYLPLPAAVRRRLDAMDPNGMVSRVQANWQDPPEGQVGMPPKFDLDASVSNLAFRSADGLPGMSGFSGRVTGNEKSGEFSLSMKDGTLSLPGIMHAEQLAVAQGVATGQWERAGAGELTVRVSRLQIDNDDLRGGDFSATWRGQPGSAGVLDMTGRARSADPRAVWRYMPAVVSQDAVDWLKVALTAGRVEDLRVRLNGELAHFPFNGSGAARQGVFRVEGRIRDATLAFAPDWPALQNLQGSLLFERAGMQIKVASGQYAKVRLRDVQASLADFDRVSSVPLEVVGVAEGPGEQMLEYLRATPVAKHLGSFIQNLRVGGDARLDLKLAIPLMDANNTRVQGGVQLDDNSVRLATALPPMQHVTGHVGFDELGVTPTRASGEFLGGHFSMSGKGMPDGTALFDASGVFPAQGLREIVSTPLWNHLAGETKVGARISVSRERAEVVVTSDLVGITSRLPPPLSKAVNARWPLSFTWATYDEPGVRVTPVPAIEDWQLSLDGLGGAHWQDRCVGERCDFLRGAAALNDELSLPTRGMRVSGRFAKLELDAWRPVLTSVINEATKGDAKAQSGSLLAGAVLQADEVIAGGQRFTNVLGRALQQDGRWVMRLQGPDIAGDLTWLGEGKGRLQAQLSMLRLKAATEKKAPMGESVPAAEAAPDDEDLPALDIHAAQFEMNDMKLGALTLQARNEGALWRLPELRIESPDAVISGEGLSRTLASGGKLTEVLLRLEASDVGGFLGRIGVPDAVKRGEAKLFGRLSWNGPATSIDYGSLAGELRLEAENGQFNKLQPGAAGRLLGILSLQSLPRRLTLDFRDVFSDGFAFDSIIGDMKIEKGVLRTNNLDLRGPAAKAFMKGSTDLGREVHDLHVTVQPTLSESVAIGLGAASLNPIIGLGVYLAQKALSDPFEKLFSFEYTITGPWADPKVDKVGAQPVPAKPQAPGK